MPDKINVGICILNSKSRYDASEHKCKIFGQQNYNKQENYFIVILFDSVGFPWATTLIIGVHIFVVIFLIGFWMCSEKSTLQDEVTGKFNKVIKLGSDTFGNPIFQKVLKK